MSLALAFKSDVFENVEIESKDDCIFVRQDGDTVVISLTDLPRFIHELKIVENEGNKID